VTVYRQRRRGLGKGVKKPRPRLEARDPHGLAAQVERHVEWLQVRGFSPYTVEHRRRHLEAFAAWCEERGITRPEELSRLVVDLYQRYVARLLKKDGSPLSAIAQQGKLTAVSVLGKWLSRERLVLVNPAADIEMPKQPLRLPQAVLTVDEAERVMAVPDVTSPLGLRDRAIIEVFYSTGIRRSELASLRLCDLDLARGILAVRQGKGRKDRFVPIGERAVAWVAAYLREARPQLAPLADNGALFLSSDGSGLSPEHLSTTLKGFIRKAEIGKQGACHIFRHTMATLMLEGGADLTSIQHILGHSSPQTTEIYAKMSIHRLKAVHEATHPGARLRRRGDRLEGNDPDELVEVLRGDLEADEVRAGAGQDQPATKEEAAGGGGPRICLDEDAELLSLLAAEARDGGDADEHAGAEV